MTATTGLKFGALCRNQYTGRDSLREPSPYDAGSMERLATEVRPMLEPAPAGA